MSIAPFTDSIGYMLKQAEHLMRLKMDRRLSDIGLSTASFAVLGALGSGKGMSGAEIARRCLIRRPTATVMIAKLEQASLIERSPSAHHGRIIETRLSQRGAAALAEAIRIVEEIEQEILDGMPIEDRQTLGRLLAFCALRLGAPMANLPESIRNGTAPMSSHPER